MKKKKQIRKRSKTNLQKIRQFRNYIQKRRQKDCCRSKKQNGKSSFKFKKIQKRRLLKQKQKLNKIAKKIDKIATKIKKLRIEQIREIKLFLQQVDNYQIII